MGLCWRALEVDLRLIANTTSLTTLSSILFYLCQVGLKVLNLRNEPILLKFHKHLFLDSSLVLGRHLLKSLLVALIFGLQLANIVVQLLLLLLHPSVVNFLEISLLSQLVIGGSRLLRNDSSLINLGLQLSEHI